MATNTPISYCAQCDAKDVEIATLIERNDRLQIKYDDYQRANIKAFTDLARANERIAELTKERDEFIKDNEALHEDVEALQFARNQLTKAEAALRWYLGECERPYGHPRCGDGVYCAKCFARAYFAAKETP